MSSSVSYEKSGFVEKTTPNLFFQSLSAMSDFFANIVNIVVSLLVWGTFRRGMSGADVQAMPGMAGRRLS